MANLNYPPVTSTFLFDYYLFLVLLDPISVNFPLPFEVIPGVVFTKASKEHKEIIEEHYQKYNLFHGPYVGLKITNETYAFVSDDSSLQDGLEITPSVGDIALDKDVHAQSRNSIKILDCEWDQWIIEIERKSITNGDYFLLLDALLLSNANLSVGMSFSEIGWLDFFINAERFYSDYPIKVIRQKDQLSCVDYQRPISIKEIEDIVSTYGSLKSFDFTSHPLIGRAIVEYRNILLLPRDSSLTIIGLFSILELLLTHDSRGGGTSGIGWQLRKKIPLINRRLERPLNFTDYFRCGKDVKYETIIEKLYLKRSLIAHGNIRTEESKKQLEIISKGDEVGFLKLLVRKIITFTMNEPDLIYDLREC